MKTVTLIFYERDPKPARDLAAEMRSGDNLVLVRAAVRHMGEEREVCDRVIAMPDVSPLCREELYRLFENKVDGYTPEQPPPEPTVIPETPVAEALAETVMPARKRRRVVKAEN